MQAVKPTHLNAQSKQRFQQRPHHHQFSHGTASASLSPHLGGEEQKTQPSSRGLPSPVPSSPAWYPVLPAHCCTVAALPHACSRCAINALAAQCRYYYSHNTTTLLGQALPDHPGDATQPCQLAANLNPSAHPALHHCSEHCWCKQTLLSTYMWGRQSSSGCLSDQHNNWMPSAREAQQAELQCCCCCSTRAMLSCNRQKHVHAHMPPERRSTPA